MSNYRPINEQIQLVKLHLPILSISLKPNFLPALFDGYESFFKGVIDVENCE